MAFFWDKKKRENNTEKHNFSLEMFIFSPKQDKKCESHIFFNQFGISYDLKLNIDIVSCEFNLDLEKSKFLIGK